MHEPESNYLEKIKSAEYLKRQEHAASSLSRRQPHNPPIIPAKKQVGREKTTAAAMKPLQPYGICKKGIRVGAWAGGSGKRAKRTMETVRLGGPKKSKIKLKFRLIQKAVISPMKLMKKLNESYVKVMNKVAKSPAVVVGGCNGFVGDPILNKSYGMAHGGNWK